MMKIKIDSRDELDARLREKISKHECIHEPELLNRITDLLIERDILIDDIQSYHDKLKEISRVNKSKLESLKNEEHKVCIDEFEQKQFDMYIEERKTARMNVPKFEEGYIVVDTTDNHVLDNKIFDNKKDAEELKKDYYAEMPSLIDNHYVVMKCSSECLQYGAFPYENTMYFIYDLEK